MWLIRKTLNPFTHSLSTVHTDILQILRRATLSLSLSYIIQIDIRLARMTLGLLSAIGRSFRRKRASSLDILSPKRAPRDFYKGKNCKSTGFHTKKGGYVVQPDKLPNYVIPDLTGFKLKPYVSQCPVEVNKTTGSTAASK
ncbi:39S ribosomal protein L41-A, mitochondrial isoform X1 [Brassica rapa]|nr:39S ribosomal protein L41-A, mitochondrial isoform X1 [Brassica rapa]